MNKSEFAKIAMALKTYYPKEEKLLPNQQAMELWFEQLKDIPYDVAKAVVGKWVATNRWSPSIAEIREIASDIVNGNTPDWSEGWEKVVSSFGSYGMYRQDEAMRSFDEITRQAVQRLGYQNLCVSENIEVDRANFRMIYQDIAGRMKKEAQMPAELVNLIHSVSISLIAENDK